MTKKAGEPMVAYRFDDDSVERIHAAEAVRQLREQFLRCVASDAPSLRALGAKKLREFDEMIAEAIAGRAFLHSRRSRGGLAAARGRRKTTTDRDDRIRADYDKSTRPARERVGIIAHKWNLSQRQVRRIIARK